MTLVSSSGTRAWWVVFSSSGSSPAERGLGSHLEALRLLFKFWDTRERQSWKHIIFPIYRTVLYQYGSILKSYWRKLVSTSRQYKRAPLPTYLMPIRTDVYNQPTFLESFIIVVKFPSAAWSSMVAIRPRTSYIKNHPPFTLCSQTRRLIYPKSVTVLWLINNSDLIQEFKTVYRASWKSHDCDILTDTRCSASRIVVIHLIRKTRSYLQRYSSPIFLGLTMQV